MINKISNYTPLFGLNTNDGYILLNRANEVVLKLNDEDVIFTDGTIKWVIRETNKPNYCTPIYRVIRLFDGEEETSSTLPNRKMILMANNTVAKSRKPFMFYPEADNQLERFLLKNGIFDFKKVIKRIKDDTSKVDYDIFWKTTNREHYPYRINIYSMDDKVYKRIIKDLL